MQVFNFVVLQENNEDFMRRIEIGSGQSFLEFHESLKKCIGLSGNELASFFVCDQEWQRLMEVTLMDMALEEAEVPLMSTVKISEHCTDLHQRFIYVYDYMNMYTFYIELMGIKNVENPVRLPRCIDSAGQFDMEMGSGGEQDIQNLESEIMKEFDDLLNDQGLDTDEI